MTRVFVGGSRHLSRLPTKVEERVDRIADQRFPILVGDANGADKALQRHLHDRGYESVRVFHSGGSPRNNLGAWPTHPVAPGGPKGTFECYSSKDRAMADEATIGLMLWDGESVVTLMNCARLLSQAKKVVLFVAPSDVFVDFRESSDWEAFLSRCDPSVRVRLNEKWAEEAGKVHRLAEGDLFAKGGSGA